MHNKVIDFDGLFWRQPQSRLFVEGILLWTEYLDLNRYHRKWAKMNGDYQVFSGDTNRFTTRIQCHILNRKEQRVL